MAGDTSLPSRSTAEPPDRSFDCPVEATLHVIGPKWTVLLIWKLLEGAKRYGELRRRVPAVSEKMLSQQLRRLEAAGVVSREVFATVPPRVVYSLTPKGEALAPVVQHMAEWGTMHSGRVHS